MFQGLFIDGFAGGGGASTGIAQAIGRDVDIAINHNPMAIAIHKANHPGTEHHCTDIREPFLAGRTTGGRRVAGAWFSPDCKEYSKAKGGPVKDRTIRALCWEVVWWLGETSPEVAYLENVEEFEYAAPLDANGIPMPDKKGREFKRFVAKIRRLGYRVAWRLLRACDYGAPTSRKRLYMVMRRDGQRIVWPKPTHAPANDNRVLTGKLLPYRTAAECIDWSIRCPSIFERVKDLVDATKRRIAHGVMRYVVNAVLNGQRPFIVPVTHTGDLRTHDSLDPVRTITTANGGELAVVDVGLAAHITKFHGTGVGSPIDKETPTVTANGTPARPAGATPLGLVGATLYRARNGERAGQAPRALDVGKPLGVVAAEASGFGLATAEMAPLLVETAHGAVDKSGKRRGRGHRDIQELMPVQTQSNNVAQVSAFLSRYYGSDKANAGGDLGGQIPVVRAGGTHHAVVAAHLEQANGGPHNQNSARRDARRPLSTATTSGSQQRIVETTLIEEGALPPEMMERAVKVAAFLVKYYGTDGDGETAQIQPVGRPLDAITTRARFAVVTVTIDAVTYVIVDIGLRMLKPRELANAQGFPPDYVLNPVVRKFLRGKWVERPLTIAEQISAIGNSVCPPVARALVAANQPGIANIRMTA
jgi:DNA (cytosine-5)-methyltransferase 1